MAVHNARPVPLEAAGSLTPELEGAPTSGAHPGRWQGRTKPGTAEKGSGRQRPEETARGGAQ